MEFQSITRWYEAAIQCLLSDSKTASSGSVDPDFFKRTVLNSNYNLEEEIMEALGSSNCRGTFVIAESQLNCMKMSAISIISYLNDDVVHKNMEKILERLRDVLHRADNVHASLNNKQLPVVSYFNEFMKSHFDLTETIIHDFVEGWGKKLADVWSTDTTDVGRTVMADLAILRSAAK